MLAIATINPDSIPETYVRQHIRLLAPGKTVVLYFEGEGELIRDERSFRIIQRGLRPAVFNKISNAWRLLTKSYSGTITGQEERRVLQFLRDNRVKSLLAEFGPTGCAFRRLCKKAEIKLIVNFHGYDATVMPKRLSIRWAYRKLARDADAFVCGSDHFAKWLQKLGFPNSKIHVVPCGIEVEKFSMNAEKDPNLIIAVGRLTEKKAPHLSIEAFAIVRQSFPSARLEIIGDGPLRHTCELKIRELGLVDCVTLHGARDHEFVRQKLSRASVFVQHSITASNGDTESQGISLLEAMISGVPVVSTLHNGFPETVLEGKTGYLVSEGDINGMARQLIRLLEDPKIRRQMADQGRSRVIDFFSAEKMSEKLRAILLHDAI